MAMHCSTLNYSKAHSGCSSLVSSQPASREPPSLLLLMGRGMDKAADAAGSPKDKDQNVFRSFQTQNRKLRIFRRENAEAARNETKTAVPSCHGSTS